MDQYLIDTNVISDYFSASLPDSSLLFLDEVFNAVPIISVITQIELLSWKTSPVNEKKIKEFIADSSVLGIFSEVVSSCVKIRREFNLKTPDAIIAATALVNNLTLITRNEKDFRNITDLKVLNPHKSRFDK